MAGRRRHCHRETFSFSSFGPIVDSWIPFVPSVERFYINRIAPHDTRFARVHLGRVDHESTRAIPPYCRRLARQASQIDFPGCVCSKHRCKATASRKCSTARCSFSALKLLNETVITSDDAHFWHFTHFSSDLQVWNRMGNVDGYELHGEKKQLAYFAS